MFNKYNPKFMELAFENATKIVDDIPVCAIITKNNEIISLETNKKEKDNITISHAEILSIISANKKLNNWRLDDCDMYVTLEPCLMCAWAIINARIKNLYFSIYDTKYGAFGGAFNINQYSDFKTNVFGGFMEDKGKILLENYFKKIRQKNETTIR